MKLVNRKELRSVYGIPYCDYHLARLEAQGRFPVRLKLQPFRGGRVCWVAAEVEAWIAARLEQRS